VSNLCPRSASFGDELMRDAPQLESSLVGRGVGELELVTVHLDYTARSAW